MPAIFIFLWAFPLAGRLLLALKEGGKHLPQGLAEVEAILPPSGERRHKEPALECAPALMPLSPSGPLLCLLLVLAHSFPTKVRLRRHFLGSEKIAFPTAFSGIKISLMSESP